MHHRVPLSALVALLFAAPPAAAQAPAGSPDVSAPQPGALFLHPERFELEDGSFATVDRGVLFVPQDRTRPGATEGIPERVSLPALGWVVPEELPKRN